MVKKEINQTMVLPIHKHGKQRLLYLRKNLSKIIPEKAELVEVVIKRVIA